MEHIGGLVLQHKAPYHLFEHRLGPGLNLLARLILDRVGNVHRVEFRASQRCRLGARRGHEFVRRYRHRRPSHAF
jgi:hypothetical protein